MLTAFFFTFNLVCTQKTANISVKGIEDYVEVTNITLLKFLENCPLPGINTLHNHPPNMSEIF